MKKLILLAALGLAACATGPGPIEVRTQDVAVTHVERAVSEQQVRAIAAPAPLAARPGTVSAALDAALAKLCEYVGFADRADALLQHAAGMSPVQRVMEPVCQRSP